MTLATEQIREILDGAPEGEEHVNFPICGGLTHEVHRLDDLREILTLRQRVEEWEYEIEIHKRHTELVGSLTGYMVKRRIGTPGECCTTGIVHAYEDLEAQQSEVAARAVEGFADKFELCTPYNWYLHAKEYAVRLRKGEGDE